MSKRFTDTEKWKKKFIRTLPAPYKLLWMYICDDCDHAGIWIVDFDVARIRIGEDVTEEEAMTYFGGKIQVIDGGERWFIQDFIDFQYGRLNPENRAHKSVIEILEKYKIKPLISPLQGAKDKDMDKDKEKEMDMDKKKGGSGGNKIYTECVGIFFDFYERQTGLKPAFSPIEGRHLNSLIKKIGQSIASSGRDPTPGSIADGFGYILNHLPKWYLNNGLSITIINSKYDELIAGIKNKSSDKADILTSLAEQFRE